MPKRQRRGFGPFLPEVDEFVREHITPHQERFDSLSIEDQEMVVHQLRSEYYRTIGEMFKIPGMGLAMQTAEQFMPGSTLGIQHNLGFVGPASPYSSGIMQKSAPWSQFGLMGND